ncbi:zinc finger protein 11-like [Cylas formicarius]|uniref:zinc finger protein 11-like n=1 Tax=Cylas formicarius TaxID=197179 RepID=UPI00295880D8|nr:zinc finger protein 11-like [Cylas formicarius]
MRCWGCGTTLRNKTALFRHKNDCPVEMRFSCIVCEARYAKKSGLKRHLVYRHPDIFGAAMTDGFAGNFYCPKCAKPYVKMTSLRKHLRIDCGHSKRFRCSFDACKYRSNRKENTKRHMVLVHDFKCDLCHKGYSKPESLYIHKKYNCKKGLVGREYRFACPNDGCTYRTNFKFNFNRHFLNTCKGKPLRNFPSGPRYICTVCGKSYKFRSSLWRHTNLECQKEPAFACYFCPYKTYQKGHLKSHLWTRHHRQAKGSYFNCPSCRRSYRQLRSLRRHVKYECQKEPSFFCQHCPYAAHQKGALYRHQRCGKSYKRKSSVYNRSRRECEKDPQFRCSICPYTAKQKVHYVKHVLGKHKDRARCPSCRRLYGTVASLKFHQKYECGIMAAFECAFCFYPCPQCPRVYRHYTSRSRHVKLECGKGPTFKCSAERCNYVAKRRGHLKTHMLRIHNLQLQSDCKVEVSEYEPAQKAFRCPIRMCRFEDKTLTYLQDHIALDHCLPEDYRMEIPHYQPLPKPFRCPIRMCQYEGKALSHLKHHITLGHRQNWARSYKNKTHLTRHLRLECNVEPKYQCHHYAQYVCHCGKSYRHHQSLYKHRRFECGKDKSFCCDVCTKSFWHKQSYKRHYHQYYLHRCPKCHKTYKYKWNLLRHLKYECGIPPQFTCRLCHKTFTHKSSLKVHVACVHEESKRFECANCYRRYKYKKNLQSHVKHECGKGVKYKCPYRGCEYGYSCKHCGKTYKHDTSLYRHKRYECEASSRPYTCGVCRKTFKRRDHLFRHSVYVHSSGKMYPTYECGVEPQFACQHCDKKFVYKFRLNQHMHAHTHCFVSLPIFDAVFFISDPISGRYACATCSNCYWYKSSLKRHITYECNKEGKQVCRYSRRPRHYACAACGRTYKHHASLYNHVKYECGVEPKFKCPECSYMAKRKHVLIAHRFTHLPASNFPPNLPGTRHGCHNCDRTYTNRANLSRHRRQCLDKAVRHECPHCEYKSYRSDQLKSHLLSHTSDNAHVASRSVKHVCANCNKAYAKKNSFYKHTRFHCGEANVFRCVKCDYKSPRKENVKKHIVVRHETFDFPSCMVVE